MQERERPGKSGGDIRGPVHGDVSAELNTGFTDWDNPEDEEEREDAPEGYYDDEDEGEEALGPDDPDYDLSEAAGYAGWKPPERDFFIPGWMIVAISLLLILALILPALRLLR